MPLLPFDALFQFADEHRPMMPVAAAGGADATVLQALRIACDRGWAAPHVVGNEANIRRLARESHIALDGFRLIDAAEPSVAAVDLVRRGEASLLMKGQIATPALLK